MPILTLVCKTYVGVLFYAFYYLLREVVYFEHLLSGSEAINAEPQFNERNSMAAASSNSASQVSGQLGPIPGQIRTSPRSRLQGHPNMLRE